MLPGHGHGLRRTRSHRGRRLASWLGLLATCCVVSLLTLSRLARKPAPSGASNEAAAYASARPSFLSWSAAHRVSLSHATAHCRSFIEGGGAASLPAAAGKGPPGRRSEYKRILVTGAAGFIAFHTARALARQGDLVVGVDNFNAYYPVSLKRARSRLLLAEGVPVVYADVNDGASLMRLFGACQVRWKRCCEAQRHVTSGRRRGWWWRGAGWSPPGGMRLRGGDLWHGRAEHTLR